MARRRYAFDEAKVQRYLAEGRGQGFGPEYRPWLQIQDVPSTGRSHRPYGIKTKRVHHFLSDGEWKCFLKFEGTANVVDILEQYPLDRLETLRVAQKLGIRHPRTLDGTPYVMTLDFLIIESTPSGLRRVPYSFKYDPQDLNARQQDLMSITRATCSHFGMELQLIDQGFFDEAFNINYDSVRACHDISRLTFYSETDVQGLARELVAAVADRSDDSLLGMCRWLAQPFETTPQVVYQVAMHLVSRGVLQVDLSSAVGLEKLPMRAYTLGTTQSLLERGR